MYGWRSMALCVGVIALTGCDGWPPHESDVRKNFEENRASLERLSAKISATDLWRVSSSDGAKIRADLDSVDFSRSYVIEDESEWHELFERVGVISVVHADDGSVQFALLANVFANEDNRSGHFSFIHDPSGVVEKIACLPEHESISCGACAVAMDGGWFIRYGWGPIIVDAVKRKAYLDGKTPAAEYFDDERATRAQNCIDGYEQIGYDVEKL